MVSIHEHHTAFAVIMLCSRCSVLNMLAVPHPQVKSVVCFMSALDSALPREVQCFDSTENTKEKVVDEAFCFLCLLCLNLPTLYKSAALFFF